MPYKNKEDQSRNYKRWYQENKEALFERKKIYNREYTKRRRARERRKAYQELPEVREREQELRRNTHLTINGRHIRVQKRPRPNDICELCGKTDVKKLDYHHWDDDHPEQGVWVCFLCHKMVEGIDAGLGGIYLLLKQSIKEVANGK